MFIKVFTLPRISCCKMDVPVYLSKCFSWIEDGTKDNLVNNSYYNFEYFRVHTNKFRNIVCITPNNFLMSFYNHQLQNDKIVKYISNDDAIKHLNTFTNFQDAFVDVAKIFISEHLRFT